MESYAPKNRTESRGEASGQSAQPNLKRNRIPDRRNGQRPEIEKRKKVGSGNESHSKSEPHNSLTHEQLLRHHGIFREFSLVDDPSQNQRNANEERAKDISGIPRMCISTSLEGNQKQDQARNGQESAEEINAFDDRRAGHSFSSDVRVREIG